MSIFLGIVTLIVGGHFGQSAVLGAATTRDVCMKAITAVAQDHKNDVPAGQAAIFQCVEVTGIEIEGTKQTLPPAADGEKTL